MSSDKLFFILFILLIALLLGGSYLYYRFVIKDSGQESKKVTKLINYTIIGGFVLLLILMAVMSSPQLLFQLLLSNLIHILVLALATTGIVLIYKTSFTTNFAQGMMATFGAFVSSWMIVEKLPDLPHYVSYFIGMAIGILASFLIGLFVDTVVIRNSKNINAVGKQMITMGLVLVLMGIMPLIFNVVSSPTTRVEGTGQNVQSTVSFFILNGQNEYTVAIHSLFALGATIVVLSILFSLLRFTKWGLGVRATASNERVAEMLGVDTKRITAMSWAIAGGLGGLAAILYAPMINANVISVSMMVPVQVNGFLAAILGGFSTFLGPLVGAIMIPLLSAYFSIFNSLWQNVIVYLIILLLVLIKPLGLFGKKVAKKV